MTLGGIAVAMGELVDDAIVDVENIFRRLQENNAWPQPAAGPARGLRGQRRDPQRHRLRHGGGDPGLPAAVRPVRVEGRLFAPLGVAYIVSILASLLVSLTVTPVLSYYLLPQSKATHRASGTARCCACSSGRPGYLIRFSMAARRRAAAADLGAGRRVASGC